MSKKRKLRCGSPDFGGADAGGADEAAAALARALDDRRALALRRMRRHEALDTVERVGGDAAAVAQPRRQLAVIDRAAAERRFGQSRAPAVIGNFLQ